MRVSQLSTSEKFTYPSIRFLLNKKLKLSDNTDKVKDTQFSKFRFNKENYLFLNPDNKITPLMFACYLGKIDIVQELLKENVRINTIDNQGRNALFYAIAGEIDKKTTKEVQELKSKIVDKLLNANINVKQQRKKEYVNVNNISKPDYVTAIDLAKVGDTVI